MTVVIPGMNLDHDRVEIRPRNVRLLQCYTFSVLNHSNIILSKRNLKTSSGIVNGSKFKSIIRSFRKVKSFNEIFYRIMTVWLKDGRGKIWKIC